MRMHVLLLMASSVGSTVVYVRLDSTNQSLAALPPNLINQCAKGCEQTVGCSGFSIISMQCSLLSSPLPSSPSDISFVRTMPTSATCPAGSKHFATFGQNHPTPQSSSATSLATSSSSSIGTETSAFSLSPVTDVTHETDSQTSAPSTLVGVLTTVHSNEASPLSSASLKTGSKTVSSTHSGVMTTVHVNEGETSMSGRTSKASGRSSGTTESSISTMSIPTSTIASTSTTSPSSTTTTTSTDSIIHSSSSTIFSSEPVKLTKSTESISTSLPSTPSSSSTTSSLPAISFTKDSSAATTPSTTGAGASSTASSSISTSAPSSTSTSSVATTTSESSIFTTTTSIPTAASISTSTSTPSSTSTTAIEQTRTRSSTVTSSSPTIPSTITTEPSTTSTASASTKSTMSSTSRSTSFSGTTNPSTATSTLATTAPRSTNSTTEPTTAFTSTSTTTASMSSPSSTTTSPSTTVPSTSTSTSTTISTTTPSTTSTSTSTSTTTTTTSPTTTEYNVLEKFTFVDVPDSNVSCYYEIRSGGRFSTNGLCPMKGSDPCKKEGLVSVFGICAGTKALSVVDSIRCVSTLMYTSSTLCVPWEAMFADKVNPTASGNATSQNCPSGTGLAIASVCTSNPLDVTMMTGRYTDNLLGFTAGGAGLMMSSCWAISDNLQATYCPVSPGYTLANCPQSSGFIGWIRTGAAACEGNNFFLNMGADPCASHSMLVAGSGGSRCIGWDSGSTIPPFSDSITQGSSWYVWNGTLPNTLFDGTVMGRLLTYEEYMVLPRVLVTPSP